MVSPWLANQIWKEAQGWMNEAAWVWRRAGMRLWLVRNLCRTGLQVGWWWWWWGDQVGPCTWRRGTWKNMQIWRRAMWVAIFSTCTSPFITTCSGFFLDLPANAWSFIVETTKWKKKKNHEKKKQQMHNWSFVRLPYCVSFLTCHGVCETVSHLPLPPPCVLSLSTQSHWSLLHKGGGRRTFLFKLCWIENPLEVGCRGFGFCSSTLNSVGERERLLSVSSLCLISGDVFVFPNFQFLWHIFSLLFREALSEEPGLWKRKDKTTSADSHLHLNYIYCHQ